MEDATKVPPPVPAGLLQGGFQKTKKDLGPNKGVTLGGEVWGGGAGEEEGGKGGGMEDKEQHIPFFFHPS